MMRWLLFFALVTCCFAAWPNPNLKYFGYYTYSDYDFLQMEGTANLMYVNNMSVAPEAHSKGMNVMYWTQNVFFEGHPLVLRSDYDAQWKQTAAQAAPMLQDGSLMGFMMGDELIANGLDYNDLNMSINMVKATFPNATVYYNEAFGIGWGSSGYPVVPPMLDILSVDAYVAYGMDFGSTYWLYVDQIYPILAPHQKVMFVPPGYSTALDNNHYCGGPCENANIGWIQQVFNWANTDPHFIGIFPWHWDQFNVTFLPGFEYGVQQLPYLKQAMFNVGQQIVEQKLTYTETYSGGICGLGTNSNANTFCNGTDSMSACPDGYEKQSWNIGITGSGTMGFCALKETATELPVGAICGLNFMQGDVVMCGGWDPYNEDPYCPPGYTREEWAPVAWGGGQFYYCAKSEPGPDLSGTICGMMTGSTGVLCNGINPQDYCPPGYAPAEWDMPFGSGTWSVCYKL